MIDSIHGLSLLKSLEIIDLSSNKIKKIEKIEKCVNLTKINLSNNYITIFEGLSNLSSLEELILYNNKINSIKETRGLISIKKLDLSHNFIDSGLDKIKNLDRVSDFSIENNPISRKPEFSKYLRKTIPKLTIFNGRKSLAPKEMSSKSSCL